MRQDHSLLTVQPTAQDQVEEAKKRHVQVGHQISKPDNKSLTFNPNKRYKRAIALPLTPLRRCGPCGSAAQSRTTALCVLCLLCFSCTLDARVADEVAGSRAALSGLVQFRLCVEVVKPLACPVLDDRLPYAIGLVTLMSVLHCPICCTILCCHGLLSCAESHVKQRESTMR